MNMELRLVRHNHISFIFRIKDKGKREKKSYIIRINEWCDCQWDVCLIQNICVWDHVSLGRWKWWSSTKMMKWRENMKSKNKLGVWGSLLDAASFGLFFFFKKIKTY